MINFVCIGECECNRMPDGCFKLQTQAVYGLHERKK